MQIWSFFPMTFEYEVLLRVNDIIKMALKVQVLAEGMGCNKRGWPLWPHYAFCVVNE